VPVRSKYRALLYWPMLLLGIGLLVNVRCHFTGHLHGLFLLRSQQGSGFELTDDLFLGDQNRLLLALQPQVWTRWRDPSCQIPVQAAVLAHDWDVEDGNGFVRSHFANGNHWEVFFSRFRDDEGQAPRGLIVGGGLPEAIASKNPQQLNDTGIAYFNGQRWYHLWCNINEAIASLADPALELPPSRWQFLSSHVVYDDAQALHLHSRHRMTIDGVPLEMDRHALFRAGDPYFILSISLQNIGTSPVGYLYAYGDEPWLGDYGSSEGNYGWVKNGIVLHEGEVSTVGNTFIGMVDVDSGAAIFLQWLAGSERPSLAYFGSAPGQFRRAAEQVPLAGNTRFLGLVWQNPALHPGETVHYVLAVGFAEQRDPRTNSPLKPRVHSRLPPH
jgi:hypothetical protein